VPPTPEKTAQSRVVGPGAQEFDSVTNENAFGVTAAPHYRQWEYDLVAPFLGSSVLEIGSGMGHFSEKLVEAGLDRVVLSDPDEGCLEGLRRDYGDRPGIEVTSITLPGPVSLAEPVESVVAMNVLEHIEDDAQALRDLAAALAPGGRIVLWVPAYMQLYGEFDRKVGHFRRYVPATIRSAVERAGLRVGYLRRVNFLGGLAWWLAVRRGGARQPNLRLVWLYDNIVVPTSRRVEKVVEPPFGQSIVCVAEVGD
jgi:SAM-dependent methyltransferase